MTGLDTFATATALLAALRDRHVSAVELLEMHLAQIARHNPALNAIVTPDYDNSRRTAAKADAARARGEDAPLLGLPYTLKDSINAVGLRSTAGAPVFADYRATEDARLTARVRAAGGVLMGKTNVPPFLGDWQSNNVIFGRTNNPWDQTRTPGGSTGGGAAALAAGLTPLEFGSDIGGSIRVPAAFCGVYGHRPSETALARSGQVIGSPLPNPAIIMGVQGPLARSAEDLALAFEVVAGPDTGEDVAWRLEIPPARHERLADYRVAVLPPLDWHPVDTEIMAAQADLAARLGRLGARVQEVQPAEFGDLRDFHALYRSLLSTITSIRQPDADKQTQIAALRATGDPFDEATAAGLEATAPHYIIWFGRREQYRAAYRAFFREWDILLCPAFPTPAYPHIALDVPAAERTHTVNGQQMRYEQALVYPSLTTLCGQPATAFPVGLTKGGLPIGLQAIGPYLEDRTPMHFAALVAREIGGFRAPPGYGAE